MRFLITGAGGMLGQDIISEAASAGFEVLPCTHGDLDITDPHHVESAIAAAQPDIVVNCAAWTDVDGAEASPAQALEVNGDGAGNVARAAHACGAWTIHVSSDYVFEGTKREPYVESDLTNPHSAYGRSKLAGEVEVAGSAPDRHTIIRSSWLFGVNGRSFPRTILALAAEREELAVVDDQVGCPTFTGHLARAIVSMAQTGGPPSGLLHLAGGGACSWFELADYLVQLAGADCQVRPAHTADMARPAPRPAYSVLRSERDDAPVLPDWREGVEAFMAVRV